MKQYAGVALSEVQAPEEGASAADFGSNADRAADLGLGDEAGGFEALHSSPDHIEIGGDELIEVYGHLLTLGEINALADYVSTLAKLRRIPDVMLVRGLELIERHDELSPTETALLQGIFPEYQDLAKDNAAHFAPPGGVAPTGSANHVGAMRTHMTIAWSLASSRGDLDLAQAEASFGAHFIADGFSAGHLFNKQEIVDRANDMLGSREINRVFRPAADLVVALAATDLAGWEIEHRSGWANITADDLASMYQVVYNLQEGTIYNAMVRALHDRLSRAGVEVSAMGKTWEMGGDENLDKDSLTLAQQVVNWTMDTLTQLHANPGFIGLDEMLAHIEGCYPQPTAAGQQFMDNQLEGMFADGATMAMALAEATSAEIDTILASLQQQAGMRFTLRRKDEPPSEEEPGQDPEGPIGVWPIPGDKLQEYIVKQGDTLFEICERELGDGWRYPEVHLMPPNLKVIGVDPDVLEVGQKLVLPPAEARMP